jgi:signal transduction histidine kinase
MSRSIARFFFYTGLGFVFYGVVAGLVPSRTTLPFLPVPVELFRGMAAVLITYFLMKALNIFDIETRHALEQKIKRLAQSEKMASLGQLAAGIAHGINTPLTNASLSLQMLRKQISNQPGADGITTKLDAVERSIDRASTIANELLQFSHVKETQLALNDINQLIDNAIDLVQYKLKQVTISTYKSKIPRVLCDEAKLEQVFVNILNNSIEAMPDGGEISISNGRLDDEVWITFTDTGPGIPDDYLVKAFDPFFTTKKIGKGTGLGLSICYAIIDQHQGKIELEGNKGKGAAVTIHLPIPPKSSKRMKQTIHV